MEFLLLGTVEARHADRTVDLGPARQRCVLAALLADANQVVTPDQLVDRVWGERVPSQARNALRSYVSRLRRALTIKITYKAGGYRLEADPETIDLHRFTRLLRTADLAAALSLWRGEPFAGLDTPWLNSLRGTLEAKHFAAELDHIDLRLRRGEHGTLVAELTDLAATHPLDERVAGQLILALYRCGRSAEALAVFSSIRGRLDEWGVTPNPALRELRQQVLGHTLRDTG